jgi:hypothetical protein
MTIDTLKVARRLREAGFSEPQAEALVAVVQEGAESADFATKGDLALLGAELKTAIEIAKSEMLSSMFQMILGAVLVNFVAMLGVMFAFAKLLGH